MKAKDHPAFQRHLSQQVKDDARKQRLAAKGRATIADKVAK